MKYILPLLFCLIASIAIAQNGYNWINYPTIDGISTTEEAIMREYKIVEGNVKELNMTSFYAGDDDTVKVHVTYSESGTVMSLQIMNISPRSVGGVSTFQSINFQHSEANELLSESVLTIIEGDTIEQIKSRRPEWFPFLPTPIVTNSVGNITQIKMFQDTTFSFYDEFNRKIMDSIPSVWDIGQKITYRYEGDKIYRNFFFLEDEEELYQKEEYTVDDHGNWVELKYIGTFELDSDRWTQLYTREITYY